jgi:hypothetical protein
MTSINLLQHQRAIHIVTERDKVRGLSLSQTEACLGKSPLRLVTKRTWHTPDSFTDTLECGHESQLQFTAFGYVEDQYLHRIQPTARRRRCQACKIAASSSRLPNHPRGLQEEKQSVDGSGITGTAQAYAKPCESLTVRATTGASRGGQHRDAALSSTLPRLYQTALEVLKKNPGKAA